LDAIAPDEHLLCAITCPHRGMPLSCGQLDGAQLECSYHGWRFDVHTGQCAVIPSLVADQKLKVDRIYAGSFSLRKRDDFIWVFIPDPGPASAGFTKAARARASSRNREFSEHYNSLFDCGTALLGRSRDHWLDDPAHGPFVHQAWWWRSRHSITESRRISSHPVRLSHERAHAQLEQRAL